MARKTSVFDALPATIKPPMSTLSPVPTFARVEMSNAHQSGFVIGNDPARVRANVAVRRPCRVDETIVEHQGGAFLVLFGIENDAAVAVVVIAGSRIRRNDINRTPELLRPGR